MLILLKNRDFWESAGLHHPMPEQVTCVVCGTGLGWVLCPCGAHVPFRDKVFLLSGIPPQVGRSADPILLEEQRS